MGAPWLFAHYVSATYPLAKQVLNAAQPAIAQAVEGATIELGFDPLIQLLPSSDEPRS